jgi:hypothetical protein
MSKDTSLFLVVCVRFDGRDRLYQAYRSRGEAEAVAGALTRVGCPARVAEPHEAEALRHRHGCDARVESDE